MNQTNRKKIKEAFNEKGFFSLFVFFLVSVAVLGSWWVWGNVGGSALFPTNNFSTSEKAGQFGDSFGALTAAFAGLSLIGVYYAIWLQRKELTAATREFKQQNETLSQQRFENTFFSMLSQHNEMVRFLSVQDGGRPREGKDAISWICNRVQSRINQKIQGKEENIADVRLVDEAYNECYQNYSHILGVYFRSLYRIFKYIEGAENISHREYSCVVRSQLTDDELGLLFWNGMTEKGKNFQCYIEQYALLNNLRTDQNENMVRYTSFYKDSAY